MGKKNLADNLKQSQRIDTGATAKRNTTLGLIWGEGQILSDGSPAKGFYIDEKLGPVVQAVPYAKYKDWMRSGSNNEKDFAAANMRLFQVILQDKKDFNELQSGSHKYELLINGEFHTEVVATPVVKMSARTLEATVPEGQSLKRKKAIMAKARSPKERIKRLKTLRADDNVRTEQFADAGGSLVERKAAFPKDGDEWYGTMKMNSDEATIAIYRDQDSDSKFIEAGTYGNVKMSASDLQFDADFKNVSYGDMAENPLQAFGASNAVTPVSRFQPQMKRAAWIGGLYDGLMSFFREDDFQNYGPSSQSAMYDHEIIDIDSFRPNSDED